MEVIETDIDVLMIPQWVIDMLQNNGNSLSHSHHSSMLKAEEDPDGDRILPVDVLTDPEWDFLGEDENGDSIEFTDPEGNKGTLASFLTMKKYKYYEVEIE